MHWLIRPWRHMLDFNGRAPRREYWLFQLQLLVLWFCLGAMPAAFGSTFESALVGAPAAIVAMVVGSVLIVAHLAVAVRRLHDHDKTGWFYLLAFVPLIGWTFVMFMMLTPGTEGENSYGYNPRYGDEPQAEDVAAVFS